MLQAVALVSTKGASLTHLGANVAKFAFCPHVRRDVKDELFLQSNVRHVGRNQILQQASQRLRIRRFNAARFEPAVTEFVNSLEDGVHATVVGFQTIQVTQGLADSGVRTASQPREKRLLLVGGVPPRASRKYLMAISKARRRSSSSSP